MWDDERALIEFLFLDQNTDEEVGFIMIFPNEELIPIFEFSIDGQVLSKSIKELFRKSIRDIKIENDC